jgi:hypothetical protein
MKKKNTNKNTSVKENLNKKDKNFNLVIKNRKQNIIKMFKYFINAT